MKLNIIEGRICLVKGITSGYDLQRAISIPEGVEVIGGNAFTPSREYGECVAECIILPNTVKKIKSFAFAHAKRLRSITIPDSVSEIDETAFFRCDSLKKVFIDNRRLTPKFKALFPEDVSYVREKNRWRDYQKNAEK